MNVKTSLCAGLEIKDVYKFAQDVWDGAQDLAQGFVETVTPLAQGVKNTVTNPKFWTWPF